MQKTIGRQMDKRKRHGSLFILYRTTLIIIKLRVAANHSNHIKKRCCNPKILDFQRRRTAWWLDAAFTRLQCANKKKAGVDR
jgi:hypothetical protein